MKKNLAVWDRGIRGVFAVMLALGAWLSPVAGVLRLGMGAAACGLLFTALAGSCLGYRLMGLSTCPVERR